MNQEIGTLNKKVLDDSNDLYKDNQKFKNEIINFVGDKAGLSNDKFLDKKLNYNTLNNWGREALARFVCSIDYTISLIENFVSLNWNCKIEILASYK